MVPGTLQVASAATRSQAARTASIALPDRLDIDGDGHLVTNDHSSPVHRFVPTHTKVMTIDLGGRDKARSQPRSFVDPLTLLLFPPGCFPLAEVADRK